jgi:hypothetical protein
MTQIHADLEALQNLRAALLAFASRATDAWPSAQMAVFRATRTFDRLEEAARDRVYELTNRLYDCYGAAAQGLPADCGQIQQALQRAEQRVAYILTMRRRFDDAVSAWESRRYDLEHALDADLSGAVTYLDRRIAALEAYQATQLIGAALSLGAAGIPDLMGAAIGAMRLAHGQTRRVLGRAGEEIASIVLSRRFGLQEVVFTQPAHGFDRVFSAPGLPLIVVESKMSQDGALRLGRTTAGEQGSAAWVAQTAARMTDPASAQWSPTNARLGRLVQEMGPANAPVLAVVADHTRATAAVYGRQPSGEWTLIEADIDLDALTAEDVAGLTPASASPASVAPPSAWSEQGAAQAAERREGAPGGAERRG